MTPAEAKAAVLDCYKQRRGLRLVLEHNVPFAFLPHTYNPTILDSRGFWGVSDGAVEEQFIWYDDIESVEPI